MYAATVFGAAAITAESRGASVYRAVDPAEAGSINKTGQFLLQNGGVEAKYFAGSLQDAHWYGQRLYPNGYSVVQGTVSSKVNLNQYWYPNIDIGAYVFPRNILPYVKPK